MASRVGLIPVLTLTLFLASGRAAQDNTWALGTDDIEARFRLTSAGLQLESVTNPRTGASLISTSDVDTSVTINGTTSAIGSSAGGWILQDVFRESTDVREELTFAFRSQRAPVIAERTYRTYRGAPVIETWMTFKGTGSTTVTVANFTVWQVTIPANVVHYEYGLRGDAAGLQVDEAFRLQRAILEEDEQLTLDERNRSSERHVPILSADLENDEFFGGVMWSGSWRMVAQALPDRLLRVTASFPRVTTTVAATRPLETPHGFFGFTPGGRSEVSRALRGFITGIRDGRPFRPLVTDNTWFSYGTEVDQASMMDEMAGAASVGAELFVVDAGWYREAGRGFDFDSGLGIWEVDRERFPDGLAALRDYAHSLGIRFGIWVEPERVALSTVGRPGLAQQAWIASEDGNSGSTTTGQICLASPSARQWVLDRLTALLDDARPDYLKWDNNLWVNCNRSGHAHGSGDGNFAHVRALYDVFRTLRERYPDMQIENCSQGGNRLDFGMLRFTDTAWMDDRTSPAVHVRHNLEGLLTFFPPAYLLSFVLNDNEPIVDSPDLGLFLRSRMPGILGLTYRSSHLTESDRDRLSAEIAVYKDLRDIIANSSGMLLTEQAERENGPPWDVVLELRHDSPEAVIFAFQNDRAVPSVTVRPRGLDPNVIYEIATQEGESLRTTTGAELMEGGLDIDESFESAAHILRLRPIGRVEGSRQ